MADRPDDSIDTNSTSALLRAVQVLFRPLVRLLIEKQITFPLLSTRLRSLYVDVAERDFPLSDRRQTDSRISLLTGIHRKDIKRLRGELAAEGPPAPAVALGALVVSRWLADPAYLDASQRPRPLPRRSTRPSEASFESLVQSVNRDIPARSVFDEWLRLGVIELDEHGSVFLRTESFVPEQGLEEKIHFFGRNARDHLASGVHNIIEEGAPFLDRSVYYDDLSPESAAKLAELAREKATEAIRDVNQAALRLQKRDQKAGNTSHRMTFGTYFYSVDESADSASRKVDEDDA